MYITDDRAKQAWEKRQELQRQVDAEMLECRQLLYRISKKGAALKLLRSAKGFLKMLAVYKDGRVGQTAARSPVEDATNLLPLH